MNIRIATPENMLITQKWSKLCSLEHRNALKLHENVLKLPSPEKCQRTSKFDFGMEPKTTTLHSRSFYITLMHSLCRSMQPVWRKGLPKKGPLQSTLCPTYLLFHISLELNSKENHCGNILHESYHWNFTEITYMGTWNKFLEHVSTFTFKWLNWFCKLAPSAYICYFCENSMIAHSALVMKDTFAPRFASIQWILDSVEFLKNSEIILAKFSSSCVYMLSFS